MTKEPIRTYRVSYRVVPDSHPTTSIILTFVVDASWDGAADTQARSIMVEDVRQMFGVYEEDWLKRTTVSRVK